MEGSAIHEFAGAQHAPIIAAAARSPMVQIWNCMTGEITAQFETVLALFGRRLAISPTGDRCVAAAWEKGHRGGVACYDTSNGAILWQRTDIRQTQAIRFSPAGDLVWCMCMSADGPRLLELNAFSGETTGDQLGFDDVIASRYSQHLLVVGGEFVVQGPSAAFTIPRLLGRLFLDAEFGLDALCISEGLVRCFDSLTGEERWRHEPAPHHQILCPQFRPGDGCFYAVDERRAASRLLIRLDAKTGQRHEICSLQTSWAEAFAANGDLVVTSDGAVIEVSSGKELRRLAFPVR